jgi:hypothetical protein
MKKLSIIIVMMLTLIPSIVFSDSFFTNKTILEASKNINKGLPSMVDSETELWSTAAIKNTLLYNSRLINFNKSEIDIDHFSKTMKKQLRNIFCTSPQTKYWRDNNLKWHHNYYDKNDIFVYEVSTSNVEC